MNQECMGKLKVATREKLEKFNSLRGRDVQPGKFWDVVVLTSVDENQRDAYELQLKEKLERKELPLIDYKVISDPPGCKIGNGGSTLYTLQQLSDIYSNSLASMRVILIHAGGYSQRLPSASALGKIFAAVPLGDPLYQMLELKLAMYVDFPPHMNPGVLVTCADDIELYSVSQEEGVKFDRPGFTALAHPSPLSVGKTHGVFVLDKYGTCKLSEMENMPCLHFLHKPSLDRMRDSGAVFTSASGCFSLSDTEFVYTDSTYYLDFDTAQSLLRLLKQVGPLECEIDAYGDFLQALGPQATINYTCNTTNVTKEESGLVEVRQKIFHHLRGTPLNVILLNNSKFYHIGTTSEYLFHLTEDGALRSELGLQPSAFSVQSNENTQACIMYSVLSPGCTVGAGSVVEYSRLGGGVSVGRGSILSSCWASVDLVVPDGVFMHSLCVNLQGRTSFVTVAFGINDNLKRSMGIAASMEGLSLHGLSLVECLSHWGLDSEVLRFSGDISCCSLWNACLFPVCSDEQSSFALSLKMLQAVLGGSMLTLPKDIKLISMQESLQYKNLEEMLEFRKGLYHDITQGQCCN
ncbi:fucose-1-phosphate guanylyltransferase [Aulostomus maculatus]